MVVQGTVGPDVVDRTANRIWLVGTKLVSTAITGAADQTGILRKVSATNQTTIDICISDDSRFGTTVWTGRVLLAEGGDGGDWSALPYPARD
jgi:hypothetical protein